MISLTEKAALKIKEIADGEGIPLIIRMKVVGGGCVGMSNDLQFDEEQNISDIDEVFIDQTTIKIVVDQVSLQYLDATVLDYLDGQFESGFKFLNPNVKSSCGCGKSVGF
jgi:iron-sulfur cluster insertion protein